MYINMYVYHAVRDRQVECTLSRTAVEGWGSWCLAINTSTFVVLPNAPETTDSVCCTAAFRMSTVGAA